MEEILKRLGRYFLLDKLAQGGMAEIYRARLVNSEGANRILVIKKIQSSFVENKEFLQMFKSEIKVTMGFNHSNIAQVYDFGEEESQPYIAMEWVDGKNLRQYLSRFNENKQPFPIELAVYIAEQAAAGIHYAHSYKDKITGNSLNIVHRDISPQNILISYEGNVKIIDFGIAKTTTNHESTQVGVIKGKPSYLSPDQISGDTLDGRSDIFSLGAVLWELLTGKKLFSGETDLAILKLIESCQTHVKPPSVLNPKIPKELDYIILKSLAKKKEKRYQTAQEMQKFLHKFLYSYMPEFNPTDLSYYSKELFKNDIIEDRKKIKLLNDKAEKIIQSEPNQNEHEETIKPIENKKVLSKEKLEKKTITFYNKILQEKPVSKKNSLTVVLTIAAFSIIILISKFKNSFLNNSLITNQETISTKTTTNQELQSNEKTVLLKINFFPLGEPCSMTLNGKMVGSASKPINVPLDTPLEIIIDKPGYKGKKVEFSLDSKTIGIAKEWPLDIQLEPIHFGFLTARTTPSSDAIFKIDQSEWKRKTPFENEKVPIGNYTVTFSNEQLGMEKIISTTIEEGKITHIETRLEIIETRN